MSFSGYPASLRYIFNRLSGFSRNRIKMPVLTPTTANPNDILIFEIGPNQKVDLSTLAFHFTVSTGGTGGTTPSVVLPKYTNSLIQNMQVDINGANVMNLENYNHLHYLLSAYTAGDKTQGLGTQLEFSRNYTTNATSTVMTNVPLVFRSFLGFLGCGKVIDTGITGPIRITLRLAPVNCLITSGTPTTFSYALSNISMQYDVITLSDGIYDQMIDRRLSSGEPISILYDNYMSYMGQLSTTVDQSSIRVPCNSQSLDFIHSTLIPGTALSTLPTLVNETSTYFQKGDATGIFITGSQIQVGQTFIPNFRQVYPSEILLQTINSLVGNDIVGSIDTPFINPTIASSITNNALMARYVSSFYLHSVKLSSDSAYEYGQRLISGIDTRGQNLLINVTNYASAGSGSVFPLVFLQCTSQVNIGAGRMVQCIL